MFRTIKKNILAPLLPKMNEVASEEGDTEAGGTADVPVAESPVAEPPDVPQPEPPPAPPEEPSAPTGAKEIETVGDVQASEDVTSASVTPAIKPTSDATVPDVSTPPAAPAAVTKPDVKPDTKTDAEQVAERRKILIEEKKFNMGNINASLDELMKIDGAIGVAVVDADSGMALGTSGGGGLNLELAAAGNSEVVKAKNNVREALGLKDSIEDILITLTSQYHLIRPLTASKSVFIYLVLNRKQANLAMARMKLAGIEGTLEI